MPAAPKVFISYSHDSEAHEDRVLDLANRLREDGIDAEIDQYETSPPEGWPTWCERRIKSAGLVLLVCTVTYLRRVDGEEAPGIGHGVLWEARIINQLLYDAGSVSARFVPVLWKEDVLPVLSRLGDKRELLLGRWWLASHLLRRRSPGDDREAEQLLCLALADAQQMQLPEATEIEAFLKSHGLSCD